MTQSSASLPGGLESSIESLKKSGSKEDIEHIFSAIKGRFESVFSEGDIEKKKTRNAKEVFDILRRPEGRRKREEHIQEISDIMHRTLLPHIPKNHAEQMLRSVIGTTFDHYIRALFRPEEDEKVFEKLLPLFQALVTKDDSQEQQEQESIADIAWREGLKEDIEMWVRSITKGQVYTRDFVIDCIIPAYKKVWSQEQPWSQQKANFLEKRRRYETAVLGCTITTSPTGLDGFIATCIADTIGGSANKTNITHALRHYGDAIVTKNDALQIHIRKITEKIREEIREKDNPLHGLPRFERTQTVLKEGIEKHMEEIKSLDFHNARQRLCTWIQDVAKNNEDIPHGTRGVRITGMEILRDIFFTTSSQSAPSELLEKYHEIYKKTCDEPIDIVSFFQKEIKDYYKENFHINLPSKVRENIKILTDDALDDINSTVDDVEFLKKIYEHKQGKSNIDGSNDFFRNLIIARTKLHKQIQNMERNWNWGTVSSWMMQKAENKKG